MAKPTTLRWTKLSIWPGDGGSPEDFTQKVCGMTSKGFSISGQTSDSNVPDCDNPDAPGWIERIMRTLSAGVTGAGLLAEENFAFYNDWAIAGTAKNVRIVVDLATNPGYYQGSFLLTKFELKAEENTGKLEISLSLDNDGPVTYTTGSP